MNIKPRTEMKCVVCGCFSSARTCWHCSTNPGVIALTLENDALTSELNALKVELEYRDLEIDLMHGREAKTLTEERDEEISDEMADIWYKLSDEAKEKAKIRTPKMTGWALPWMKELHAENEKLKKGSIRASMALHDLRCRLRDIQFCDYDEDPMAAVQGLVNRLTTRIKELESEVDIQQVRIVELEAELAPFRAIMSSGPLSASFPKGLKKVSEPGMTCWKPKKRLK